MSIIFEALKKAEKDRRQTGPADNPFVPVLDEPKKKRIRGLVPFFVLLGIIAAFAILKLPAFNAFKKPETITQPKHASDATDQKAVQTLPIPNPEVIRTEAMDDFAQGRLEESLEKWSALADLLPQDATAHNNLGVVLKKMGENEKALSEYQKALALKPDYPEALNNTGILLMENSPGEAILSFNKAIRTSPDYADPYFHLALLLEKNGQTGQAVEQYRRFLDLSPAIDPRLKGEIEMRILALKAEE